MVPGMMRPAYTRPREGKRQQAWVVSGLVRCLGARQMTRSRWDLAWGFNRVNGLKPQAVSLKRPLIHPTEPLLNKY
jgi:hypothetical protein